MLIQEIGDVLDVVPIPGHEAGGGEAHGDEVLGHIRQVQVHAVFLVATLVLEEK